MEWFLGHGEVNGLINYNSDSIPCITTYNSAWDVPSGLKLAKVAPQCMTVLLTFQLAFLATPYTEL